MAKEKIKMDMIDDLIQIKNTEKKRRLHRLADGGELRGRPPPPNRLQITQVLLPVLAFFYITKTTKNKRRCVD